MQEPKRVGDKLLALSVARDMHEGRQTGGESTCEKARFEYCVACFELQRSIGDSLERRARFFLSFIAVSLGATFMKFDLLRTVWRDVLTHDASLVLLIVLSLSLLLLGISWVGALITLVVSMRLRMYNNPYPDKVVDSLFSPASTFVAEAGEAALVKRIALNYAVALEANARVNTAKGRWLTYSFSFIVVSVFSFYIFCISVLIHYIVAEV